MCIYIYSDIPIYICHPYMMILFLWVLHDRKDFPWICHRHVSVLGGHCIQKGSLRTKLDTSHLSTAGDRG
jgi:hypothetical protein